MDIKRLLDDAAARMGMTVRWEEPPVLDSEILSCMGCNKPYRDFPMDVLLSDNQWLLISGKAGGGGVMCATCIVERAARVPGITVAKLTLE